MANSIKDIYNQIIEQKETMTALEDLVYDKDPTVTHADALLADLDSGSKVSIWRLWAYVIAVVIYFHEKMWDLFKTEVETKLKAIPGTDVWLAQECRKFQYPGVLKLLPDGTYGYDTIDEDLQIVARVAVTGDFGASLVKVAAQDSETDPLRKFTNSELTSFQGFLNSIQYAGSSVKADSKDSDKIQIGIEVFHNALVPLTNLEDAVELAVDQYLANLDFDGSFKILKLIDAIQGVNGVTDVSVQEIKAKSEDAQTWTPINRIYNPASGYLVIEPSAPLSQTIKYTVE